MTHMFSSGKVKTKSSIKVESVCPVCQYLARDLDDIASIRKEGACTECYINFRHSMGEKWSEGERPSLEEARKRMNILIDEV